MRILLILTGMVLAAPIVVWSVQNGLTDQGLNRSVPRDGHILSLVDLGVTLPNGEQWSGLTSPAGKTVFREDRPRMLITPESLEDLRQKLAHPVYAGDVAAVRNSNNATDRAFCYAVWGNEAKGREAVEMLAQGKIDNWTGVGGWTHDLQRMLMYDWLYTLMTDEQRAAIEAEFQPLEVAVATVAYYHSDQWHRSMNQRQMVWSLVSDSPWAMQHRKKLFDRSYEGFKIYEGGALDVLTSMSLANGGSWHAGNHSEMFHGYEGGFASEGGPLLLKIWEAATNEPLFSRTTFFEYLPYDVATSRRGIQPEPGRMGKIALEYCTGVNSSRSAGLAKWLLEQFGYVDHDSARVLRLLLSDLRVPALSPEDLNLPLHGFQDGSNCVYVRSDWSESSTNFLFFARHWDRGRYEQASSQLVISKGGQPVLPLSTQHKSIAKTAYTQLRVWNPRDPTSKNQGSTYWGDQYGGAMPSQPQNRRAFSAENVVDPDRPWHRPETLTDYSEANGVVTATTRFEKLLGVTTPLAERTVVIDPHNETVRVTDRVELAQGLATESNFGLHEEPTIQQNVIENSRVRITILTSCREIVWDPGEREDDNRGTRWTIGTVKIRPEVVDGKVEAEMLIEVK